MASSTTFSSILGADINFLNSRFLIFIRALSSTLSKILL
jgi:hypothetical protein